MAVGVQIRQGLVRRASQAGADVDLRGHQLRALIPAEGAAVVSLLLRPFALTAIVFGLWRLTADMAWTEPFPITDGLFSRWQVWLALGIALQTLSRSLASPRKESNPLT